MYILCMDFSARLESIRRLANVTEYLVAFMRKLKIASGMFRDFIFLRRILGKLF